MAALNQNWTHEFVSIYFLVLTNAGSMNAYTRIQKDKLWKVEKDGERLEEDGIEVASFIKTSASVTNIHGSILLKPSEHDFYKML